MLTTSVVLADDHALIREGLKRLISLIDGYTVLGEVANAASLVEVLKRQPVDILVLDLGMPGLTGLNFIRELRDAYPGLRILILTANTEARTVRAAFDAGASGYLVKSGDLQELKAALDAMRRGETYIDNALGAALTESVSRSGVDFDALSPVPLTPRERELLALIARGAVTRDIAERLGISPLTARKHRENLMRKLDLHNAAELAAYAVRLGLPGG
ncbi:response regulator [Microvirga brassicacearum]|uniref:Response regulator transcription factor n=1 Tax=Microvirga brassicacearum TaxID=2580413 RepID=A0A5N3PGI9_9HYPH|nr:response regulator transcription factor [Microvirga brassicacearum]KAB0268851.1 response regulator transcription factor [Microvirga brassicacearum]